MTLPDNFPAILTDLQDAGRFPRTHLLEIRHDSIQSFGFVAESVDCDDMWFNCVDPLFTPWLTSLAMHLLGHLENRFYLSESIIDIESDGLCIHLQKHTNTPQSIALAIIQAAHAVLVEKK